MEGSILFSIDEKNIATYIFKLNKLKKGKQLCFFNFITQEPDELMQFKNYLNSVMNPPCTFMSIQMMIVQNKFKYSFFKKMLTILGCYNCKIKLILYDRPFDKLFKNSQNSTQQQVMTFKFFENVTKTVFRKGEFNTTTKSLQDFPGWCKELKHVIGYLNHKTIDKELEMYIRSNKLGFHEVFKENHTVLNQPSTKFGNYVCLPKLKKQNLLLVFVYSYQLVFTTSCGTCFTNNLLLTSKEEEFLKSILLMASHKYLLFQVEIVHEYQDYYKSHINIPEFYEKRITFYLISTRQNGKAFNLTKKFFKKSKKGVLQKTEHWDTYILFLTNLFSKNKTIKDFIITNEHDYFKFLKFSQFHLTVPKILKQIPTSWKTSLENFAKMKKFIFKNQKSYKLYIDSFDIFKVYGNVINELNAPKKYSRM